MTRILTIARVVWLNALRRKDVYVIFVLLLALLMLLMSLNIFGLGDITGYIKESGLFMAWLFAWILAVHISARLLPEEESRGTIFSLMARPVTRAEVVAGKWLGCWIVVGAATIAFYAVLSGIVLLRGTGFSLPSLAQALFLHLCMLGMISALGVAFSARLTYDAAAVMTWTVSLASFCVLPRTPHLIMHADGFQRTGLLIVYYLFPHLQLFDMRMRVVHDWGVIPAWTFLTIIAYGVLMTIVFLVLGWLAYRTKRFERGGMQ